MAFGLGMRPMVNARRSIHHVPELPHDYSQGIPNLMSPGGFSIAWTEYMKLMVEKLNALTVGMCGSHSFERFVLSAMASSPTAW